MAMINGTAGDDTLVGTALADVINGLRAMDTITGLAGNDVVNGGAGNDTSTAELATIHWTAMPGTTRSPAVLAMIRSAAERETIR